MSAPLPIEIAECSFTRVIEMLMHEITGPGEGLKEEDCERKKVVIQEPVKDRKSVV